MRERTAVVLGGGPYQMPLVRHFLSDYRVYVVNPVATETTRAADGHIACDILDVESTIDHIRQLPGKPVFVVSDQSDVATLPVAQISAHFSLPGNSLDSARRFTLKDEMYELAGSLGIPVLPFRRVRTLSETRRAALDIGYPVILKPTDSTNSRGVYKVDTEAGLSPSYERSCEFSRSGALLVQKYVSPETQIVVEGLLADGAHRTIVAGKKGAYWSPAVTSSIVWPFSVPPQIAECNDLFVSRAGLSFGMTHAWSRSG